MWRREETVRLRIADTTLGRSSIDDETSMQQECVVDTSDL
jgi:hypothetical protein